MSKQINLTHQGKVYTLEFTRKSVEIMERQGFAFDDLSTKPITAYQALFAGAFIAHHKFLKREVIDEIFDTLNNKQELFAKLLEMYADTINTLMGQTEDASGESDEKNVKWEASW